MIINGGEPLSPTQVDPSESSHETRSYPCNCLKPLPHGGVAPSFLQTSGDTS
jgi:hypothetical protein